MAGNKDSVVVSDDPADLGFGPRAGRDNVIHLYPASHARNYDVMMVPNMSSQFHGCGKVYPPDELQKCQCQALVGLGQAAEP